MIPEYGRYIQNMAKAIAKIEDKEKRNVMAKAIIELMSQASPQFKNIEEYRHKLWDHLIMISDFKLVIDSPYPFPERKDVVLGGTPPLPYPSNKIKMRHYGKNLEKLVAKAKDMDEEKLKEIRVRPKTGDHDVETKVKEIICAQLEVAAVKVRGEASFVDDLKADSLAVVELVLALEEAFSIEIPDEDTEQIKTVKDAIDYIKAHAKA